MSDKMAIWVNEELESRGWSQRELARRAQLSHTTISKVLSNQMKASFEFCEAVARAFGEPPEKVFRLAGLLPTLPGPEDDPTLEELLENLKDMNPGERQQTLNYARYLRLGRVDKVSDAARYAGIPSTASQSAHYLGKEYAERMTELFSELNEERQKSVREYIEWQIFLQRQEIDHGATGDSTEAKDSS